ncbi:MAG: hypothetical protein ABH846_01795, partial [Patescibacteria group bacterium]
MLHRLYKITKNKRGQTIAEAILAMAVFAIVGASVALVIIDALTDVRYGSELNEATYLVNEGLDATRSIRDNKWLDLTNGTHGLQTTSGYWEFSGTSETIGDYTRTVTVETVDRDTGFSIISSGTRDPRTKKVTVEVSWDLTTGDTKTMNAVAYLMDWNVYDWWQKSDTDFAAGTLSNVTIAGSGDTATIELATSGGGPGGADIWTPGGGSTVIHDTDTDFAPGTFSNTVISGTGTNAEIVLDSNTRWTTYVSRGNDIDELYDIDIQDVSTGWAVGRGGFIVREVGNAWYKVNSPVAVDLGGVFMVDNATEGWACGKGGVMLRWDGVTWFEVSSPTGRNLNHMDGSSSTDAWAVGANGEIIHYDGGNWTVVSSPTGSELNAVHAYSSSFAVAVGKSGVILHYNGSSWSTVTSPVSTDLLGVHAVSPTDIWAVGINGVIIHYDGVSWSSV